jgi:hypothetical protein
MAVRALICRLIGHAGARPWAEGPPAALRVFPICRRCARELGTPPPDALTRGARRTSVHGAIRLRLRLLRAGSHRTNAWVRDATAWLERASP